MTGPSSDLFTRVRLSPSHLPRAQSTRLKNLRPYGAIGLSRPLGTAGSGQERVAKWKQNERKSVRHADMTAEGEGNDFQDCNHAHDAQR